MCCPVGKQCRYSPGRIARNQGSGNPVPNLILSSARVQILLSQRKEVNVVRAANKGAKVAECKTTPGNSSTREGGVGLEIGTFPSVFHVRGNTGWTFPAVGKETQHRHIDIPGCICAVDLMLPELAFPITGKISTCTSKLIQWCYLQPATFSLCLRLVNEEGGVQGKRGSKNSNWESWIYHRPFCRPPQ